MWISLSTTAMPPAPKNDMAKIRNPHKTFLLEFSPSGFSSTGLKMAFIGFQSVRLEKAFPGSEN